MKDEAQSEAKPLTAVEKQRGVSERISLIRQKINSGYFVVLNEAEYESLPSDLKGHKNIKINKPLQGGTFMKWRAH